MVREKGKGNSFRPPCLLEGMHLSALSQPEVDLRINIMKQRDLRIKRKYFHALKQFCFLYNCFHEISYYMSLHLVFIYDAVELQLASLSDPVWVTYFRGRPELWLMQSTTSVVIFRTRKRTQATSSWTFLASFQERA